MVRLLVLVIVVSWCGVWGPPREAGAETAIELSFDAPLATGESSWPRIRTTGSWDTGCESGDFRVHYSGYLDWGDGESSEWSFGSEGYILDPHSYDVPGRYIVRAFRSWWLTPLDENGYPTPGEGACVRSTGTHAATVVVEVVAGQPGPPNGSLGVFGDPGGSICAVPMAEMAELFVVASRQGQSMVGVGGAEFRVQASGDLVLSSTAMPGWIAIGNPLGDGVTVAQSCANVQSPRVPMLRVFAFSTGGEGGSVFVQPHRSPSHPRSSGLTLTLCDEPVFTVVETASWHSALVGSPGLVACQGRPTAVAHQEWGTVKALFR